MRFVIIVFILCLLFEVAIGQQNYTLTSTQTQSENYYAPLLGNGMIGLLPTPLANKESLTTMNGLWDSYGRGAGVSNIMPGFGLLNFDLSITNGPKTLSNATPQQYSQTLDMKTGILTTQYTLNKTVTINIQTMALRQLPFATLKKISLTGLENVEGYFTTSIEGNNVIKNIKNSNTQVREFLVNYTEASSPTGGKKLAAAQILIGSGTHLNIKPIANPYFNRQQTHFSITKGQTINYYIVASQTSSAHFTDVTNQAIRMALFAALEQPEKLINDHKNAWQHLWQTGNIDIAGNTDDQLAVRFMIYNLYANIRKGSSYSIGPMGLSGIGYNGHIFWDMEMWMYPALLMLQPEMALSALMYRYQRLPQARRNAFALGYKGAMFPWESAETGEEETPVYALSGPFEHHITADVALAFWNYYRATQDTAFLRQYAWPVLKQTATFWQSRVTHSAVGYHIRNVVCADEYAENVDDNAFTNAATIANLQAAIKTASILKQPYPDDWQNIADSLVIHTFDHGVIREHATYNPDYIIKQADVNLLTWPLQFVTDRTLIEKNLTYYQKRVSPNGPAMTQGIYALIHARLNQPQKAYKLFKDAYTDYQRPPYGVLAETRKANNPYFVTGAGGVLQSLFFGFGGIDITDSGVTQNKATLPKAWDSLKITSPLLSHP